MNKIRTRKQLGSMLVGLTCVLFAWQNNPVMALSPEPQSEQFRKAEALYEDSKYAEALVLYKEAAQLEPDNSRVHQKWGAALLGLKRYDEAIEIENIATRLDPSSCLPHVVLSQVYAGQGRTDDAMTEVKTAIRLEPKNFKAVMALGYVLMLTGRLQESLAAYRVAAQIKPDETKPYLNMSIVLGLLGDKKGAITASLKAIEIKPKESHGYVTLANAYVQTNDVGKAIESYNKALALDPKNTMAISALGDAYQKQGKMSEAIAQQQEALRVSPDFSPARLRLAELLDAVGDKAGAEREYQEAIRQTPREAGVLCGYGLLLDRHGNKQGAIEYYKRALIADPHWKIARNALERLVPGSADAVIAAAKSASASNQGMTGVGAAAAVNAPSAVSVANANTGSAGNAPGTGSEASAPSTGSAGSTKALIVNAPVKDKWALVIGISKFQNPAYNLKYAAKDAQDFYNFLIKEANFRPDHVKLLVNEQATRKNIMAAFGSRWLPSVVEPGDLAVVYVSTHGTPASADNESKNYIVAYDTEADDPYSSGVDMDEVYRRIRDGVKTNRALIVLDTCYSGGAVPQGKGLVRCDNFDLGKVQLGNGHLIVSSSNTGERSWESKRYQNGVFTYNLIEALRGNGTKIDVPTAFKQMQDKVRWEVKCDYGAAQTPQMGGDWKGDDLILSVVPKEPRTVAPGAVPAGASTANPGSTPASAPAAATKKPALPQ